jgi:NAD(P)-dependent dehydrogenase (short-subunit alcohol dehydrogenase family)
MTRFNGKSVLITGGAGGMGQAAAREFLGEGASVVIADIDEKRIAAATAELSSFGAISGIRTDVTRPDDCRRAIDAVVERHGKLDILVNGAGVWVEGPAEQVSEAEWDRTVDINLKGTFFCCRHAIPHLVATQGCILNIISDAGLMGYAGTSVYCASKGGVTLLTRSLGLELAPKGVRVNGICPCDVDTPMIEFQAATYGGGDPEGYKRKLLSLYPQGRHARFVTAEEVAAFILFLCSAAAAPITGACLPIDFGLTAGR